MSRRTLLTIHIKEGWHTYWKNPGESGMAPQFQWNNGEQQKPNYEIKEIHWPAPQSFEKAGIGNYVYKDKVEFIVDLRIPKDSSPGKFNISAALDILVCKDICMMESTSVYLSFTVEAQPRMETMVVHPRLAAAMEGLPRRGFELTIKSSNAQGSKLTELGFPPSSRRQLKQDSVTFFAHEEDGIFCRPLGWEDGHFRFKGPLGLKPKGLFVNGKRGWTIGE
jgi:thiol:disulfide interchange protein DsbD